MISYYYLQYPLIRVTTNICNIRLFESDLESLSRGEYDECEKYVCKNSVQAMTPSLQFTLIYFLSFYPPQRTFRSAKGRRMSWSSQICLSTFRTAVRFVMIRKLSDTSLPLSPVSSATFQASLKRVQSA